MNFNMQEKIGNITLDYEFYPGEDFYCDGEIEDTLLEIVKNHSKEEYDKIITESESWPILYHLSESRGNIVNWIPMSPEAKVLEVGSGCGAITGTLAEKARHVTCVDLSKKRSMINAYRNRERDNVLIHVGNFKDIEPALDYDYDYVMLIGVFEYGQAYIGGKHPYEEFLSILLRHLKPEGHLVIAIENKFGLKYWAGCREDHLGTYFSGLEDYRTGGGVRTFTRRGLEKIMKKNGVKEYHFYYPYPDYKFMHTLYSDARLPKPGELSTNHRNFDMDRLELFDEQAVFDTIIREEEFPLFSNSYLVITGKEFEQQKKVIYSKSSNERDRRFCIRTDLVAKEDGLGYAVKYPLNELARTHVEKMAAFGRRLSEENQHQKVCFVPSEAMASSETTVLGKTTENGMASPILNGISLQELIRDQIESRNYQEAEAMLLNFIQRCREYLAGRKHQGGSNPLTDLDFILPNIFVEGEDWYVIDYEWSFEEEIPENFVIYRALFRASIELPECELTKLEHLLSLAEITEQEAEEFRKMEEKFQHYISGGRVPLRDMVEVFGRQTIPAAKEESAAEKEAERQINLFGSKAAKIFYSIDQEKNVNGKAVVSGWACAKIHGYGYIPAEITIFDESGNTMERVVSRRNRPDVMEVLKAKGQRADGCGFEAVFPAGMKSQYTIRFSAGKCLKEVVLSEVGK